MSITVKALWGQANVTTMDIPTWYSDACLNNSDAGNIKPKFKILSNSRKRLLDRKRPYIATIYNASEVTVHDILNIEDFIHQTGPIIDLHNMTLSFESEREFNTIIRWIKSRDLIQNFPWCFEVVSGRFNRGRDYRRGRHSVEYKSELITEQNFMRQQLFSDNIQQNKVKSVTECKFKKALREDLKKWHKVTLNLDY